MLTQPQACFDAHCPQAGKSQGFALPSGDPHATKLCILLETPAKDEIEYDISLKSLTRIRGYLWDVPDYDLEIERRKSLYPGCDHISRGVPVVGAAGIQLFASALKAVGLQRRDCYIANVLQCYPGKDSKGEVAYPKGDARHTAESCCARLWWRIEQEFKPTISLINIHPQALNYNVVAFPVQVAVFAQAKKFMREGHKVVVACGAKAASSWFGYGENVTKWAGHWQHETDLTRTLRARRLA